ncbi:hypothetical protein CDD83_831 [Cordyceps sp. RAO-2017]|nr:hypothetical protein CDD83_831 [Cordyceps sp. RAO-2017]
MTGIDVLSYFTPPDPKIIHEAIDRYKAGSNTTHLRYVKRQDRQDCPGEKSSGKLTRSTSQHTTYESYMKFLGISASASISGWGQSASVGGSYLDQAQFSSRTLTFVTKLQVEKQQDPWDVFEFNNASYKKENFHETHGDRFIRALGFQSGGKLVAIITVASKDKAHRQEVETNAQAAINYMGVSGSLSVSGKSTMEVLGRSAMVKIEISHEGDLAENVKKAVKFDSEASSVENAMQDAKSYIDQFQERACRHDYKYTTLLEKYTTINNFPRDESQPFDYDDAIAESYGVFKELVRVAELAGYLGDSEVISEDKKREIGRSERDMIQASKEWVRNTSRDPTNFRNTADELLAVFRNDFYKKYDDEKHKEAVSSLPRR